MGIYVCDKFLLQCISHIKYDALDSIATCSSFQIFGRNISQKKLLSLYLYQLGFSSNPFSLHSHTKHITLIAQTFTNTGFKGQTRRVRGAVGDTTPVQIELTVLKYIFFFTYNTKMGLQEL